MELLSMICAMGYAQETYFAAPELVQRKHFTEVEMTARMTPELKELYANIKGIFEKMVEAGMLSNEDAAKMFTAMILNYQTSRRQFQRVETFVTEVFQKRAATASQIRSTGQHVKDLMGSEPLNSKALRPRSSKVDYQSFSDFDEIEEDN
jgi:polyhydroxyalkanoate synthesis regulator phasin